MDYKVGAVSQLCLVVSPDIVYEEQTRADRQRVSSTAQRADRQVWPSIPAQPGSAESDQHSR